MMFTVFTTGVAAYKTFQPQILYVGSPTYLDLLLWDWTGPWFRKPEARRP